MNKEIYKRNDDGEIISLETYNKAGVLHGPSILFLKDGKIITFFQNGKPFSIIRYDSQGTRQGVKLCE
jgi:hypothetical protein